jgi:glycogen synthase
MKVLMFGWEFPPVSSGGLGTACFGLTKGLNHEGVEVTFVLPRKIDAASSFVKFVYGDTKMKGYLVNSLLNPYQTEEHYSFRWEEATSGAFNLYGKNLIAEVERYGFVAKEIAESEDFDVIHAHDWLTFKAGITAKMASGKPLIVHVHATELDRTGGNGTNQYVYDLEREGMHLADAIIAVSNFTKQKIVEHYGVSPEKIRVVHNAVAPEEYTLDRVSALKSDHKVVLFLGRLTVQKGPDYFIAAAKKVLQFCPNTLFVVGGSGDMERALIQRVAEMGIADKVLFCGFVRGADVSRAYGLADVYVMPSVSEPFGITPLESIIHGTPVIISKQSGVSEVINHCFKVDFWDVDELTNKIVSVLKHDSLKQCLVHNGRVEVSKISWNSSANSCLNVYQEVSRH